MVNGKIAKPLGVLANVGAVAIGLGVFGLELLDLVPGVAGTVVAVGIGVGGVLNLMKKR